jgi:hypothetical protein
MVKALAMECLGYPIIISQNKNFVYWKLLFYTIMVSR